MVRRPGAISMVRGSGGINVVCIGLELVSTCRILVNFKFLLIVTVKMGEAREGGGEKACGQVVKAFDWESKVNSYLFTLQATCSIFYLLLIPKGDQPLAKRARKFKKSL